MSLCGLKSVGFHFAVITKDNVSQNDSWNLLGKGMGMLLEEW